MGAVAVAALAALALFAPPTAAQTPPPLGYTPVEFTPQSSPAPAAPPAPAAAAPTPATPAKPASPASAAPPPSELGPGMQGPAVHDLEQRLAGLRYHVGAVDGVYDADTGSAVMAYQKVTGMSRTGVASPDVIAGVNATTAPPPLVPGGGPTRVEIDLTRQVLFLYKGDVLGSILPVSTGNGERFCSGGWCRNAVTNTGSFKVYRRAAGWETSPLGRLYNPLYFDGGIAVHGSTSVPAHPASHGCVRIPMSAAEWFPNEVPNGTPVHVLGG
ncbi:MAG TPA: L,D-transpeptidase family protein [Acidimicrobiales bacterium]|nr:L,D-transpeptidase family protein [Acidimicrobiales bacterium]